MISVINNIKLFSDVHGIRESIKVTRSSHWQCLKCGKKFYFERHLDLHIERRHNELINKVHYYNGSPYKQELHFQVLSFFFNFGRRKTLCAWGASAT